VRALSSLTLIGLLMLCPLICGVEELGHQAHRHGSSESTAPSHCPEQGDNCICEGAVQPDNLRAHGSVPEVDGLPLLLDLAIDPPLHPLAHLTSDGSPTGLAGWGNSHAVRAFLQNYRC
jgi:hypothetical protein